MWFEHGFFHAVMEFELIKWTKSLTPINNNEKEEEEEQTWYILGYRCQWSQHSVFQSINPYLYDLDAITATFVTNVDKAKTFIYCVFELRIALKFVQLNVHILLLCKSTFSKQYNLNYIYYHNLLLLWFIIIIVFI